MAAQKKGAIDILILTTVQKKKEYLEIDPDFRTDGGEAKTLIKGTFSKVKESIDAGRKDKIEGVEYITTKKAPIVGVINVEVEGASKEQLADAQVWMETEVEPEIIRETPGTYDSTASENFRQGYTGVQVSW